MKSYLIQIGFFFLLSLPLFANEGAQDSFITNLNGSAYYATENNDRAELLSFIKIPQNSEVYVEENSNLQIVYLSSGIQETWSGPITFTTGDKASLYEQSSPPDNSKTLPPFMLNVLLQSPEVISSIKTRQGMIRVRSLLTARKVKEAEKNYLQMLEQVDENDITPEIYLITTLDNLRVYNRMTKPLEEMIRKQPNNLQAKELYEQFNSLMKTEKERIQ
ncbi:MAG: hypothetical protein P8Y20_10210 [Gammaproteobacteria bacterium]|jgi:hypothetical protein